ncbi:helix-turn-helix domain-containing protein [Sulfitobacter pseudonitzschiae]|uniref:Helix-turn-helix domain-containing protein n=1 Tax=Pseudosulfitobacter pseudonitzschiae TaxID=1402135 RepID=A0A9Q2P4J1_9RHOB|nr:helix-turn-helix domain-containing protein [Pseudosulfitobacter pseudonitzschiae]MBM2294277.1 helix-turn-helix domain-containing protein [Pseudosulfitobacter pseudonitzschiae]MBM2299201.1 helix-turn-helix domain-containing protein [Pseudosulfitobacter pseudonitzschiae]MBM2304109.1 helix-turn-helix domain-containing protein [Pseudosulfitobacter pseudonitzschiae]MBM2313890.1 helix-turn-helix domain-containing protein [Pseudosulfitobacter pseudonitzschiae]MBM2318804.1 helix-turn-helix domain-c
MHSETTHMERALVGTIKPRLLSIPDSVNYAATSRSTLYAEEKSGRIKFVKMGSSTRIEVSELDRWIDSKTGTQAQAA